MVRIVSPAGPVDRARVEKSLEVLRARGFALTFDEGIYSATDYLAGDDARRLTELKAALADPEADIIWAARGGYGTMRLLPELEPLLDDLLVAPKILAGFSDLTALHAPLNARGLVTLHSCVVSGIAELGEADADALFRILAGETPRPIALDGPVIRAGQATGPLVGGNLSVLTRLLGTPHAAPLEGALLLLEDVGERPYRLDRMLTHLELAGAGHAVAGVVVGELTGCEEPGGGLSALEVVTERLRRWSVPVMAGAPIGHGPRNRALPLGSLATLDTDTALLSFSEPAFKRSP